MQTITAHWLLQGGFFFTAINLFTHNGVFSLWVSKGVSSIFRWFLLFGWWFSLIFRWFLLFGWWFSYVFRWFLLIGWWFSYVVRWFFFMVFAFCWRVIFDRDLLPTLLFETSNSEVLKRLQDSTTSITRFIWGEHESYILFSDLWGCRSYCWIISMFGKLKCS